MSQPGPVPSGASCPLPTCDPGSLQEAAGIEFGDIRTYKLGKKRWSYNQIELTLVEAGGLSRQVGVKLATHTGHIMQGGQEAENGLTFDVTLTNDEQLALQAYLVYGTPHLTQEGVSHWTLVGRHCCSRGCEGPVLRQIQRLGKLGKRSRSSEVPEDSNDKTNHNMKDSRYLYLSMDEAGTHVGWKLFRVVVGIWDAQSNYLGAGVSPPFRILANNDVPNGAAHMQIFVGVASAWSGWQSVPSIPLYAESAATATMTGALPHMAGNLEPQAREISNATISLINATAQIHQREHALVSNDDIATPPVTSKYCTRRATGALLESSLTPLPRANRATLDCETPATLSPQDSTNLVATQCPSPIGTPHQGWDDDCEELLLEADQNHRYEAEDVLLHHICKKADAVVNEVLNPSVAEKFAIDRSMPLPSFMGFEGPSPIDPGSFPLNPLKDVMLQQEHCHLPHIISAPLEDKSAPQSGSANINLDDLFVAMEAHADAMFESQLGFDFLGDNTLGHL
jgi:hypothetical protein